ncbi:ATP-binding protein [Flavobacteriaceae bacterium]|nr:ATP-binding protein [Flavobacteriaceae bacterium]
MIRFFGTPPKTAGSPLSLSKNDSVTSWIQASKNTSYALQERKQFLIKAYHIVKASQIDTTQARKLTTIAFRNLRLGDTTLFKKRTNEALALATQLNDSFAIGDGHWNYASYYNQVQVFDSAYHHFDTANKYFDKSGYIYESAKMQYGMAFIKGRFKDYSGSEVLTFMAIKKFKQIKDYKSLYSCYDHLGILQNDIQEFDKALYYYNKSLEYLEEFDNNQTQYQASLNNIGITYLKKKDYTQALQNFNTLLENDRLKLNNKDYYARALDNRAYCKLLMKDTLNVSKQLNEALQIRDSLDNKSGVVISKIHLARYYSYAQDSVKAIAAAKEANRLAEEIRNSRDYLESLSILANLDAQNSAVYLKRHIEYSDSLQIIERKIQNKFTRIAFETDEYIEETERLAEQKVWITTSSFIVLLFIGLLFFIWHQKSRHNRLLFENDQQKANEQIYLISLRQQEKLENEKIKERNRISEELHDGVLGQLFGTRMNLGFLAIKGDENTLKQHQIYIDELQTIEREIRNVSHELSDNIDSSQINFLTIIHDVLKNKSKLGHFQYELDFDEAIDWQKINQIVKANLYRIIQEALQNIVKHAQAKNVSLFFKVDEQKLAVEIKDDGVGFDNRLKRRGIGVKNMKSRIKKLNGVFTILSKPTEGTQLTIRIPFKS